MATSTSAVALRDSESDLPTRAHARRSARLGSAVLKFGVPAGVASLGTWVLRLEQPSPAATSSGRFVVWLYDQPLLLWTLWFVLVAALVRYWFPAASIQQPSRSWREHLLDFAKTALWLVAAGALALTARALFGEPCKVRSTSMLPSFYPGDLTWMSRSSVQTGLHFGRKPLSRGDTVFFEPSDPAVRDQERLLLKRIVGLAGDTLSVQGGAPVINGWGVPRCFVGRVDLPLHSLEAPVQPQLFVEWLGDATYLTLIDGAPLDSAGPFVVKPNEIWVLGDNRNHSVDSRNWFGGRGGGVPIDAVRGAPSLLFGNLEGVAARGIERSEILKLPPGAEALASVFARCLSLKPKVTQPPASASR